MPNTFVAYCHLTLHDNLYYASRELGRFYETEKYLHNYGLTYALGLVKPAPAYFTAVQVPRYQTELTPERVGGVYVTPARPLTTDFTFTTFKMATVPYYSFTPQVSSNRIVYGRAKEIAPGATFEFYIFADHELPLPHWIRLGKWMAKAELAPQWFRVGGVGATRDTNEKAQPVQVDCPLNPLDIDRRRLYSYDVVTMPPVSLLTNASVTGAYCRLHVRVEGRSDKTEVRTLPLDMGYFGAEVAR